jgi:hypothetical protein
MEKGYRARWRQDEDLNPQVLFDACIKLTRLSAGMVTLRSAAAYREKRPDFGPLSQVLAMACSQQ